MFSYNLTKMHTCINCINDSVYQCLELSHVLLLYLIIHGRQLYLQLYLSCYVETVLPHTPWDPGALRGLQSRHRKTSLNRKLIDSEWFLTCREVNMCICICIWFMHIYQCEYIYIYLPTSTNCHLSFIDCHIMSLLFLHSRILTVSKQHLQQKTATL